MNDPKTMYELACKDYLPYWSNRKWTRLLKCTAWVSYDDNSKIYWLKSYETIVGYYDCTEKKIFWFGRYTRTTYIHMRKFRNWLWFEHKEPFYSFKHAYDIPEINKLFVNWFK